LPATCDKRFAAIDRAARREWLQALENLFLAPTGLSLADVPPPCPRIFLAGFCSVVDWLGSRSDGENFCYCQEQQELSTYFQDRCKSDARRVLDLAGVIGCPHEYEGVQRLLKPDDTPRMVQNRIDAVPPETGLTIVEAPTGSGKTEAALAHAWRLVAAGLADSIVFALPTQATANAMLGRLWRIAPLLFDNNPNLLLAHGMARHNDEFASIKHAATEGYDADEDGWAQCSQWLAESRKRVFLGQVGVCTLDQVLISVLPVRHRFVRGFGLARSVLIVDEVHAYDAYMYGLLGEVLRQQKGAGGSAILLSATLPERQRRQLCDAWGVKLSGDEDKAPYPLITQVGTAGVMPFELDKTDMPEERIVRIEPVHCDAMIPDETLLLRMVEAAEQGAQVALVCNLVDVAQRLARALRGLTGLPVDLFHARYCYTHRQRKEKRAIMRFGPKGKRRTGRILVATQVVEQSLDLDFDWLITQLCPVDLLFQRMGRLHRHERSGRPQGFETPCCTVLLPLGDGYGLHEHIYSNTRLLWRTAEMLNGAKGETVVFPEAYRAWIERVYRDEAWHNEPAEVTAGYDKFVSNVENIKKFKADYMIRSAMNPFNDTEEAVLAVTRDGEMNLAIVPFCPTPRGKMLMDGRVFEECDEKQRIEVLTLNTVGVPRSWRQHLPDSDEGRYWLELQQEGDGYRGHSKGVTFRYHQDTGLEKEK
jgi:CRISPR-associated endonuclease/helicase Cas3